MLTYSRYFHKHSSNSTQRLLCNFLNQKFLYVFFHFFSLPLTSLIILGYFSSLFSSSQSLLFLDFLDIILIFSSSSISRFFITFVPPYLPGVREERRGNTRFTHGGFDFPGFQDHPRKPHEHSYRKESSKGGVCFTVVEKGGRYHRMVILSPRLRDR